MRGSGRASLRVRIRKLISTLVVGWKMPLALLSHFPRPTNGKIDGSLGAGAVKLGLIFQLSR